MSESVTLLSRYLAELEGQRQLSAHTVAAYRRDLERLLQLVPDITLELATATSKGTLPDQLLIQRLIAKLHTQGLQPRSIARILSAWRSFFRWLGHQGRLANNPAIGVAAPRRSKPLPKSLNQTDAVRLVAQAGLPAQEVHNTDRAKGQKLTSARQALLLCNKAMFELLYSSGLRVSELVGIDIRYTKHSGTGSYESAGWLDADAQEVQVTGKGRKSRRVPVGRHALEAIQAWLDYRTGLPATAHSHETAHACALFIDRSGRRLSRQAIYDRLQKHSAQADMPVKVHPHMLRHSFASHILQGSGDLRAVQDLLGHQSITSTQIYTSLDFQRLAQVYDQAHPRARRNPAPSPASPPALKEVPASTTPDADKQNKS